MSAPVFLKMESGERRKIDCSSGVQQGDAMGPTFVLHAAPADAEADSGGVRVKRCGDFRPPR